MIGVAFEETMRGTWHRLDAPGTELPIEFRARASLGRMRDLLGNGVATLEGTVVVEGLTHGAEFRGTLGLGALARERRLPYAFSFKAEDGRTYRFDGAKEVSVMDLSRTMTTLPAYLFNDAGEECGRAVLYFDLRGDLLKFLRSWRPFRSK